MSSFVIGLDIGNNHITATLVRIEQSSNRNLSIERDTFYIRSFRDNIKKNPRLIISTWIDCIDDLLHDFIDNYQEDDTIIGIACGIFSPMDYERGICHIQSSKLNKHDKFFGLNLRLLLQSGLRDLIFRWKHNHYSKCYTPRSSISHPKKLEETKRVIVTSSAPRTFNFPIVPTINEEIQNSKLSIKKLTNYCGLHDNENDEIISHRETCIPDIEIISPKLSVTTDNFPPKLWSIIEQLSEIPISFYNDTTCFAIGEANNIHNKDYERILVLTLGTNFGSTFIDRGKIILNRHDIPSGGILSNCPYDKNSIAGDCFSTRGLIDIYKEIIRRELNIFDGYSLALRASNGDENAIKAFQIFARRLGEFLVPYIEAFHPNLLLIGGGVAQAWYLIENELKITLQKCCQIEIYFSLSNEKSICLGAVQQQLSILFKPKNKIFRQTDQYLLPVIKTINSNQYDLYPCHEIPIGYIGIGHKQLNEKLFRLIKENNILLIDGFVGTYFDEFADEFNKYYLQQIHKMNSPSLVFYDTRIFLQTDKDSDRKLSFKSIPDRLITDFIDLKKLNYLQNNLSCPCVIIGPGASFINETSPLIYIDLPKNELYYRIAAQTSFSYLKPNDDDELTSIMHEKKCLYYLDYPIFNKLKQELLPRITFFVDGQRPNCPTWINGDTFRQALAHISNQPIRVRPWFEPKSWSSSKNYARSLEMITSENGIILSDINHHLVELSWDIFYGSQANRILGNDTHYRLFNGSNDFPIRFNFLDMIDGENLSIQCHSNLNLQYIRTNFAEKLTHDKTYYIIETKQHCKKEYKKPTTYVYLGLKDNVNPKEFHQTLRSSHSKNEELNLEKYLQCIPSNIHDFFLIPNETIHAISPNQVVLEISTTPYIHDWLRLDLDDHLQSLNIEHGTKNLKSNQHGKQLRCQPISIKIEQAKYEEQHLATHDLCIYDVQRLIIEANESIEIIRSTENRFHLCILVQGDAIEIEFNSIDNNQQKQIQQYNYIETFLIPSSINEYRLRPIIKDKHNKKKSHQFILLIIFLKWDCEKLVK